MAGKTMSRFIVLIIINQFLFSCSESKCEQDITNCFENALLDEFKQTGKDDLGYKYLKSHFTKDPLSNRIIISSKNKLYYAYPSNEGWYAQEENNIQKYSLNELGHFLGDELINENHIKSKEKKKEEENNYTTNTNVTPGNTQEYLYDFVVTKKNVDWFMGCPTHKHGVECMKKLMNHKVANQDMFGVVDASHREIGDQKIYTGSYNVFTYYQGSVWGNRGRVSDFVKDNKIVTTMPGKWEKIEPKTPVVTDKNQPVQKE